ncbi:MAG: holA [Acidobacteria bacterium]|jgi:DNA polymerase-3 subunit delta|nr:holA [Acidobacteriota bacterium]
MAIFSREDLRNHLKKREIAPVYLLFGAETYLRDLAAKTIADFVFPDETSLRDFNENEFSLNQTENLQYALASAEQMPMIAARRVIRIADVRISATAAKDNLKEDYEEVLTRYLKRPAETSVVIFVADEIDKRRRMSKLLIENSVAVEFAPLEDADLRKWIRDRAKEFDADIDEKAANHLIGLIGSNARKITSEVEKLAVAALPDKLITYELVESLVPNSREMSNFDLTDHLIAKNKTRALHTLKKILDDGAEPLMLLGLIANNFHRLFLAREMMNQGVDRKEVARVMRLPYGKQEDFLATARRTDSAQFSRIMQRIAETDIAIKTSKGGGGNLGSRMQIEMLVCELATF